jgi:hypothetical protein
MTQRPPNAYCSCSRHAHRRATDRREEDRGRARSSLRPRLDRSPTVGQPAPARQSRARTPVLAPSPLPCAPSSLGVPIQPRRHSMLRRVLSVALLLVASELGAQRSRRCTGEIPRISADSATAILRDCDVDRVARLVGARPELELGSISPARPSYKRAATPSSSTSWSTRTVRSNRRRCCCGARSCASSRTP